MNENEYIITESQIKAISFSHSQDEVISILSSLTPAGININELIPSRPAMPKVSRNLHNSGRYNACVTSAGLVVQSHSSGNGRLLPVNHPQFKDYVDAISSAIDPAEADAFCRALLV